MYEGSKNDEKKKKKKKKKFTMGAARDGVPSPKPCGGLGPPLPKSAHAPGIPDRRRA